MLAPLLNLLFPLLAIASFILLIAGTIFLIAAGRNKSPITRKKSFGLLKAGAVCAAILVMGVIIARQFLN